MKSSSHPINYAALGWAALSFLLFIIIQMGVTFPLSMLLLTDPSLQSLVLSLSLLLSSIITSAVLYYAIPPLALRGQFRQRGVSLTTSLQAFFALLLTLVASNGINEFLDLPNLMEDAFLGMSQSIWGILAVGVFGPICEELVFRGGIMRPMLRGGFHPWVAIGTSAVLFGLIHGNPAQIVFAALVGLAFGVVYYATRSLFITTLAHIFNNTCSVLLMNFYGEQSSSMTFTNELGTLSTILLTVVSAVAAIWLLRAVYRARR